MNTTTYDARKETLNWILLINKEIKELENLKKDPMALQKSKDRLISILLEEMDNDGFENLWAIVDRELPANLETVEKRLLPLKEDLKTRLRDLLDKIPEKDPEHQENVLMENEDFQLISTYLDQLRALEIKDEDQIEMIKKLEEIVELFRARKESALQEARDLLWDLWEQESKIFDQEEITTSISDTEKEIIDQKIKQINPRTPWTLVGLSEEEKMLHKQWLIYELIKIFPEDAPISQKGYEDRIKEHNKKYPEINFPFSYQWFLGIMERFSFPKKDKENEKEQQSRGEMQEKIYDLLSRFRKARERANKGHKQWDKEGRGGGSLEKNIREYKRRWLEKNGF